MTELLAFITLGSILLYPDRSDPRRKQDRRVDGTDKPYIKVGPFIKTGL